MIASFGIVICAFGTGLAPISLEQAVSLSSRVVLAKFTAVTLTTERLVTADVEYAYKGNVQRLEFVLPIHYRQHKADLVGQRALLFVSSQTNRDGASRLTQGRAGLMLLGVSAREVTAQIQPDLITPPPHLESGILGDHYVSFQALDQAITEAAVKREPHQGIIAGHVEIGPFRPVESVDDDPRDLLPLTATYAVRVSRQSDPQLRTDPVAVATVSPGGNFALPVNPGSYIVSPGLNAGRPVSRYQGVTVRVVAGNVARVTLRYDTGIR